MKLVSPRRCFERKKMVRCISYLNAFVRKLKKNLVDKFLSVSFVDSFCVQMMFLTTIDIKKYLTMMDNEKGRIVSRSDWWIWLPQSSDKRKETMAATGRYDYQEITDRPLFGESTHRDRILNIIVGGLTGLFVLVTLIESFVIKWVRSCFFFDLSWNGLIFLNRLSITFHNFHF